MNNSNINKALLLCGDTFAKPYYHNKEVRESHSSKYLFGDAGAALLLEKSQVNYCLNIASCTDGNRYKAIIDPYNFWRHPDAERNGGEMDDIGVFKFSTSEAPKMITEYMVRMNKTSDDYDMLVLHPANTILMVGFCTPGSLGGRLAAGEREVSIFGKKYEVKARVEVMNSYSAHADYHEMLDYLSCQKTEQVKKLFLVHGEYDVQKDWREKLIAAGFKNVEIPEMKSVFPIG